MKKYISPVVEVADIETQDLILASGYQVAELKGVDKDGSKSAIFDVGRWFS